MKDKLKELEKKIGYEFRDFSLLRRAMMHSSYTNEKHLPKFQCNERLEFLGDAVLELVSSEFLFLENPKNTCSWEKARRLPAGEEGIPSRRIPWRH